jgi:hypothetical protein
MLARPSFSLSTLTVAAFTVATNYYHEDFLRLKPGGSKNLDMVVNGLPSYVLDEGVATGAPPRGSHRR